MTEAMNALDQRIVDRIPETPADLSAQLRLLRALGQEASKWDDERDERLYKSMTAGLAGLGDTAHDSSIEAIGGVADAVPPKPAYLKPKPDRDPYMAFAAQARALRGLAEASIARGDAQMHGDETAFPDLPSHQEIAKQYSDLDGRVGDRGASIGRRRHGLYRTRDVDLLRAAPN